MYCLDTFALVEISEENPHYSKFFDSDFVITAPTLAEFYLVIYKKLNQKTADYWLEKLKPNARAASLDVWIRAVKFRHERKKENLSIFDAIGYAFSLENGYIFVTGDVQFKDKKGVEYVK